MKINIGRLVAAIGRVAVAAAKNPATAVSTATTIALAANQVVDGVATIARAVKKGR